MIKHIGSYLVHEFMDDNRTYYHRFSEDEWFDSKDTFEWTQVSESARQELESKFNRYYALPSELRS